MKTKLIKLAAKVAAVSMVVSMFAPSLPVSAALATNRSVSVTRHQATVSTGVIDTVSFTSQDTIAGLDATPPTLSIALPQTGTAAMSDTDLAVQIGATTQTEEPTTGSVCTAGAAQVAYDISTDGTVIVKFCTGSTAVSVGTVVTVTIGSLAFSLTNPAVSTGTVTLAGTAGVTGTMLIPFITSDQVTVTANIAQTMVFDVGVNASCAASAGGGGTVALGSLTTAGVSTGASHICLALDTNADGGAVIQVRDTANGLVSASPVYTIQASGPTQTLAGGTEGYGLCVSGVLFGSGTIAGAGNFSATNCGTHLVGQVTSTFADLANTGGNPVDGTGYQAVDLLVKAAIASITPASTAYADTLTFRATATF